MKKYDKFPQRFTIVGQRTSGALPHTPGSLDLQAHGEQPIQMDHGGYPDGHRPPLPPRAGQGSGVMVEADSMPAPEGKSFLDNYSPQAYYYAAL